MRRGRWRQCRRRPKSGLLVKQRPVFVDYDEGTVKGSFVTAMESCGIRNTVNVVVPVLLLEAAVEGVVEVAEAGGQALVVEVKLDR
jgi:hypothetical protein